MNDLKNPAMKEYNDLIKNNIQYSVEVYLLNDD